MPLGRPTKVGLSPGDIVLDWGSAPPSKRERLHFRSVSIVAKRSPISATAELLLHSSWQNVVGMPFPLIVAPSHWGLGSI